MRKQFLLDIETRLFTLVDESDPPKPIIKLFDLWNNQLSPDWQEAIKFPAAFLEYMPITWEPLGQKKQGANINFRLHICSHALGQSSSKNRFRDNALAHYDLVDSIHYILQGFNGSYFGTIGRIGSIDDIYHNDIIEDIEIYRCRVLDDSALRPVVKVEGDLFKLTLNP